MDTHTSTNQKTLKKAVSFSGVGIFTGAEVRVVVHPAPVDAGIVFVRADITGSAEIRASVSAVQEATRCTCIGAHDHKIFMVEHLLSALYAYGIDNARIEVFGPEIPGMDGSSLAFTKFFDEVGLAIQGKEAFFLDIEAPVSLSSGSVHLIALPSDELRFSFTMHYPSSKAIGTQYYTFAMSESSYKEEIAPCRTFSVYEEVFPLLEKGIIKGGALENALVIKEDKIMNPEGARFKDEMVRHKVLDLIGDISLIGKRLRGHIIAICSGHATNVAFAKKLLIESRKWTLATE